LIRVEKAEISNSFPDYKLDYKRSKLVNDIVQVCGSSLAVTFVPISVICYSVDFHSSGDIDFYRSGNLLLLFAFRLSYSMFKYASKQNFYR